MSIYQGRLIFGVKRLKVNDLSYSYGKNTVFADISFEIKQGEFIAFIGPSGTGKTTLLHVLAGLFKNYHGSIENNFDNYSMVFQKENLFEWMTLYNNIVITDKLRLSKNEKELVNKYLKLVNLDGFENYYPEELSGGMKKRGEIARSLYENTELIFLDEPFSSLDIITREKLNILLKKIIKNTNKTVIMVTHSVEEACFLADKIYILNGVPAKIIDYKILNQQNKVKDSFYLTDSEIEIEKSIRKKAKDIWTLGGNTIKENKRKNLSFVDSMKISFNFLIVLFFFILLSYLSKILFSLSDYQLPYPHSVIYRFFSTIFDGSIFRHIFITFSGSITGFFIAFIITFITGYLFANSDRLYSFFMPVFIAANTIPSVAIFPFLILWFGFSFIPKILISVLIIFFPLLINTIYAFRETKSKYLQIVNLYRPPFLKKLLYIEIPASLPQIFNGIKVSITLSVIGSVIGEFFMEDTGLGALVQKARSQFDTELMFVALIWLIILGLSYFIIANLGYLYITKYKIKDLK